MLTAIGVSFTLLTWFVIALLASIFWIIMLIDVIRRDFRDPTVKIVWVVVILFSHIIGSLIYYFAGRPLGTIRGY